MAPPPTTPSTTAWVYPYPGGVVLLEGVEARERRSVLARLPDRQLYTLAFFPLAYKYRDSCITTHPLISVYIFVDIYTLYIVSLQYKPCPGKLFTLFPSSSESSYQGKYDKQHELVYPTIAVV